MTASFSVNATVLLKKFSGEEGERVDVQKLFGYIGLFTLVALWWLSKFLPCNTSTATYQCQLMILAHHLLSLCSFNFVLCVLTYFPPTFSSFSNYLLYFSQFGH